MRGLDGREVGQRRLLLRRGRGGKGGNEKSGGNGFWLHGKAPVD